jgi:serine/threonine-protein kinase
MSHSYDSSGTDTLPAEFLQKASGRLGVLALVYAITYFVAAFLVPPPPEFADHALTPVVRFGNASFIAIALLLFAAIKTGRIGQQHLLATGFVFESFGVIGIEWGLLVWDETMGPTTLALPWTAWTPVWIVIFPLLVPSAPWKTFWAATAAASVRPLMLVILAARDVPLPEAGSIVPFIAPPYLCVGIAIVASTVVYGLGRDVSRARRMGSYQLKTRLGEGGMGEVWMATHRLLARSAAIKLIRPEALDPRVGSMYLQRFEREVQATAKLRSPHTIEVYDYGHTPDGTFYYVMEHLDGLDLENLIIDHGPLEPGRVVHILRQVCHSLAEAHEQNLVHRDIKPANIFVCRLGRDIDVAKVLDFGLVKAEEGMGGSDPKLTTEGSFYGTPAYASPEAARGQLSRVDGRSDLYSLACVGFWCLTGKTVFEARTPFEMLVRQTTEDPDPPSRQATQEIPEVLDQVILDCLRKDQSERTASAEELDAQLAALQDSIPWPAARAAQWWEQHRPPRVEQAADAGKKSEPTIIRM